jgi:hypothetical protein
MWIDGVDPLMFYTRLWFFAAGHFGIIGSIQQNKYQPIQEMQRTECGLKESIVFLFL